MSFIKHLLQTRNDNFEWYLNNRDRFLWRKYCLLPIWNAVQFMTSYRSVIYVFKLLIEVKTGKRVWDISSSETFNSKQYEYFSHLYSHIYQRIHFVFEYFHVANMRIKVFADVAAMSRLLHFISRYTQNGSQQQHTAWSRFYFSRWFMEIAKFISNLFGYFNILGPSAFY